MVAAELMLVIWAKHRPVTALPRNRIDGDRGLSSPLLGCIFRWWGAVLCGVWDLHSPLQALNLCPPAVEVQSPNHWPARNADFPGLEARQPTFPAQRR